MQAVVVPATKCLGYCATRRLVLGDAARAWVTVPLHVRVEAAIVARQVLRAQRRHVRQVAVEGLLHGRGEGRHLLRQVLGLPYEKQRLSVLSAFPTFVPSLSWQNDSFKT